MLGSFTLETFSPAVGGQFRVRTPAGELDAVLAEATALPPQPHGRAPFSLLFRAGQAFPQGCYTFTHPDLGAFELFVVPLGPDAAGLRYEAVFG
jgi:hypothetical protein